MSEVRADVHIRKFARVLTFLDWTCKPISAQVRGDNSRIYDGWYELMKETTPRL